jgi:hypothetical protein
VKHACRELRGQLHLGLWKAVGTRKRLLNTADETLAGERHDETKLSLSPDGPSMGEAKAREIGQPMIIAMLYAGGYPKTFRRMASAVLAAVDIALTKATTAVLFEANSEAV